MMLNILLYEPDREKSTTLRTVIHSLFLRMKAEYRLRTYFGYEEILAFIADQAPYQDVALIELDDAEKAGRIANAIRASNQKAALVFIGQQYQQLDGFLFYRPSAFLQYPFDARVTAQVLCKLCREQNRCVQSFLVRSHECVERVPYENIEYFESTNRKVALYTNGNSPAYEFYAKLEDVAGAIASDSFYRCHQSYIVNLQNVQKINRLERCFITASAKKVLIAKRILSEASVRFERHVLSNAPDTRRVANIPASPQTASAVCP